MGDEGLDWLAQHGDMLYRYAISRVNDADTAADLVQDTFVAALRAKERFRGEAEIGTWLVGILRHKIVDHFRKSQRLRTDPVSADDHGARSCRWPRSPDRDFENQEFWVIFDECRRKLPAILASVFTLRELEQKTTEEICRELSITPTNLSVRLFRARSLLRDCLEIHWFGPLR